MIPKIMTLELKSDGLYLDGKRMECLDSYSIKSCSTPEYADLTLCMLVSTGPTDSLLQKK